MAKVKIEFEDIKPTPTGGWLNFSMSVDPPLKPDANNKIYPEDLTMAQELANEVAWFIKDKMTHRVMKGGK